MEIANIRIDERLIHGQVAAIWSKALNLTRIMVIDEDAVKNPTQKSVLKMACPAGCKLSILSVESAAANLALYDAGYHFDSVNVGNMAKKDNSTQIGKSVCVTPQDVEDFRYLDGKGVSFGMQRVPTEASESLMDKL